MTPAGRRPGQSGTREAIAAAARRRFARDGYDRASLRAIADEAGVDPALVSHFYGSKEELFVAVVALPFDPAEVLPSLLAGEQRSIGLRLAVFIVSTLESEEGRVRIVGRIRAAASEPRAAALVRELVERDLLVPLAENIGADQPSLRASLLGAQVVGLTMARYIVGVEPLASLPADAVAAIIAPTLQRLLTGDLEGSY
jgi:AcrR family transcriptional regulator